jgi:ubiquinone/menaquinone biosynthesis C-methylase UbiE
MSKLDRIYAQVPSGYYYQSLKTNHFQKYWHGRRFIELKRALKGYGGTLLDIGCADGVFTNEIYRALNPGSHVFGIDIYHPSIAFAQKQYPQIKFRKASAEKLPYEKQSFDIITCLEMLEHVTDPNRVLMEMRRVLKPKGSIFILVPQENLLFKTIWFMWTRWKGKVWDHSHLQHFYLESMTDYFKSEKFIIKKRKTFILDMLMLFELGL